MPSTITTVQDLPDIIYTDTCNLRLDTEPRFRLIQLEVIHHLINNNQLHNASFDQLNVVTLNAETGCVEVPLKSKIQHVHVQFLLNENVSDCEQRTFLVDHTQPVDISTVFPGLQGVIVPWDHHGLHTSSDSNEPNAPSPVTPPPRCVCGCHLAPPYEYTGGYYCEQCYIDRVMNATTCDGCGSSVVCSNVAPDGNIYCMDCACERFEICASCRAMGELGTMFSNGLVMCSRCYSPEWPPGRWECNENTYRLVPNGITFGVELETVQSPGYQRLEGTHWGCAHETSTGGKEFISPILEGDKGLDEIARFIEHSAGNWEVDDSCGTHIHLSMKGWTLDDKARIAYVFRSLEGVFTDMLPSRMNNPMCGTCHWDVPELLEQEDIEDFAMITDKFNWFNLRPLLRQDTVELRLLHGTLDAKLINEWIKFAARLIKLASSLSWHEVVNKFGATPRLAVHRLCGNQYAAICKLLEHDHDLEFQTA